MYILANETELSNTLLMYIHQCFAIKIIAITGCCLPWLIAFIVIPDIILIMDIALSLLLWRMDKEGQISGNIGTYVYTWICMYMYSCSHVIVYDCMCIYICT